MSTEEQRALLFSDDEIHKHFGHESDGAIALRDFYEAKITSGELRVVKTVTSCPDIGSCTGCGWDGAWPGPFCPGCGAKIVEP